MIKIIILAALSSVVVSDVLQGKEFVWQRVVYTWSNYTGQMCVSKGRCPKTEIKSQLVPIEHNCVALCRKDYKDSCASAYFDPSDRHCHILTERCDKAELTDLDDDIIYFRRRKFDESSCPDLHKTPLYDCSTQPADLVFILDLSGSIDTLEYQTMMNFVKSLVEGLDVHPDTKRIAMVTYSTFAQVGFYLNTHPFKKDVLQGIDNFKRNQRAWTNTGAGLKIARDEVLLIDKGARYGVLQAVIVITDGHSNRGPNAVREAEKLRNDGVVVIAVGVGRGYNQNELLGMAGPDVASRKFPDRMLSAVDFKDLARLKDRLIQATCDATPVSMYTDTYCCMTGVTCEGLNMYKRKPWKNRTRQFCADKCSRILTCGMFDWVGNPGVDVTDPTALGTCYHKVKTCKENELKLADLRVINCMRLQRANIDYGCPSARA